MSTVVRCGLVVTVLSFLIVFFGPDETKVRDLLQVDRLRAGAKRPLNTTVVILNWSRLSNVNRITSHICDNLLDDTVDSIIVWNNNPTALALQDFPQTRCPPSRLQIINSPKNLYFQARFMACARATTSYCFIQDDDFLVQPEIIRALSYRINDAGIPGIHLQPPHEMLLSQLRITIGESHLHTTFAWLGYGTIIKRSKAAEFLSLLNELGLTPEEHQMADNYFTILSNTIPERWFDPGIELGGGQPFTVGQGGEDRNNRHVLRAAGLLDSVIAERSWGIRQNPFISVSDVDDQDANISRAPCHKRHCIFETSISLLPKEVEAVRASSAVEMLELGGRRLREMGQSAISHYLSFSPSHAVDRRLDTVFRSAEDAQKGDWVKLNLMRNVPAPNASIILVVDDATVGILRNSVFESSVDGDAWISRTDTRELGCRPLPGTAQNAPMGLISCYFPLQDLKEETQFRVRLLHDMEDKWTIYEMDVRVLLGVNSPLGV